MSATAQPIHVDLSKATPNYRNESLGLEPADRTPPGEPCGERTMSVEPKNRRPER